ncbi:MAG: L-lactate dehydrogenase [Acidaminococcaceae bacterium]|nr:L-lactate dehydrogenase [Acidaminococcaceae bacterium]MDD4722545.1 L-lactate dehydrogenase [Acidaminococcaceae bacterium]
MVFKKRIVGVVGLGHVGAHVAYALGIQGFADEILLCDKNQEKLISERQDLMDAVKFMPHHVDYQIATYEELNKCDIIVNSIGDIALCATGNRDDEMNFTVAQVKNYIPKIKAGGFKGYYINITNPCDVITALIAKLSELPKGHVMGTGTGLDTSRLVSAIAQQTGIDHKSITAYMMGEHGAAQMVPWSLINFGGKPLADLEENPKFTFNKAEIRERTINGGWVTYRGKHCTEYGICSVAAMMVNTIYHDEKRIMASSAPLDGEYGESGIFAGCPALIGGNGIEEVIEYNLPPEELKEFKTCCEKIRLNIAKSEKIPQAQ